MGGRARYVTADGVEADVVHLRWQQTYAGWFEGDPEYMNHVILTEQLPARLAEWRTTPHVVLGADERRTPDEAFGLGPARDASKPRRYLPGEAAIAFLTSSWCKDEEDTQSRLVVAWFQDTGADPFARLGELLAGLDWKPVAAGWSPC